MHLSPTLPPLRTLPSSITAVAIAAITFALAGCTVGPDYVRPATPDLATFKEAAGWVPAAPADALERGPWWQLFQDPVLDGLAARVEVSNQNVAAAVAAYAQARAVVREQRASFFPTVSLDTGVTRSGSSSSGNNGGGGGRVGNNFQLGIGGSWEPDVWGRLGRGVEGATASAQASAADLASARLSAQGELAVNYLTLRQSDAQARLLDTTLEGYRRSLQIAQNRYDAGVAARTDVLQAQTQLTNALDEQVGLQRTRAQLEHAIAVLIGEAPGNFTLPPSSPWNARVPDVPLALPSTLLQRRPDIAAAERSVATANAQIGIARSAYYPSLSLSASVGQSASRLGDLFSASSTAWSFGLSAAQTLFNAGATTARVDATEAAHAQAVARYRQTVLAAFQDVEDQLSATRVLLAQQDLRRQASESADLVEQQVLNRYRSGQVGYSEVITAQATALNARRSLVQAMADRQTTAVALIQAVGGGWGGLEEAR